MNSRIFFLALNTGYSISEEPSDQAVAFYRERSGDGLYCAIVGNVVTPAGFGTNNVCMRISDSPRWRELSHAIASGGAKAGLQLSSAWPAYRGMKSFVRRKDSDPIKEYKAATENLSPADIEGIFEDLGNASRLAIEAGFEHLQLHAAHGYLYSLLIDPFFCPHYERAIALIGEWAYSVRKLGAESSIRLSLTTGNEECDGDERISSLERVVLLDVDVIDVSDGFYNVDKHRIYPSQPETLERRHQATISLAARFPERRFIISGRAGLDLLSSAGNLDLGICRDLIANPTFLRMRANGCENLMECHFFSRGKPEMTCGKWAKVEV